MRIRLVACLAILAIASTNVNASGHGPVFGFATPVNS
jgi:hypothetical protein